MLLGCRTGRFFTPLAVPALFRPVLSKAGGMTYRLTCGHLDTRILASCRLRRKALYWVAKQPLFWRYGQPVAARCERRRDDETQITGTMALVGDNLDDPQYDGVRSERSDLARRRLGADAARGDTDRDGDANADADDAAPGR